MVIVWLEIARKTIQEIDTVSLSHERRGDRFVDAPQCAS